MIHATLIKKGLLGLAFVSLFSGCAFEAACDEEDDSCEDPVVVDEGVPAAETQLKGGTGGKTTNGGCPPPLVWNYQKKICEDIGSGEGVAGGGA